MKKTMRVGRVEDGDVFVQVEHDGRRLSLHGVVGPKANGDCSGSCGQIVDTLRGMTAGAKFAPGWGVKSCARLVELWDRWHLNDMRPGCEHQEAEKRAHPLPVLTVEKISVFPKLYALEKEQKRATTAEEAAAVARQIFEIDAIFTTTIGFRDTVLFRIDAAEQRIDFRSSSNFGLYDFGKNRSRMKEFTARFAKTLASLPAH